MQQSIYIRTVKYFRKLYQIYFNGQYEIIDFGRIKPLMNIYSENELLRRFYTLAHKFKHK